MIDETATQRAVESGCDVVLLTPDSNLRYRVIGVDRDVTKPQSLKGVSCGDTWKGFVWGRCPRCGDVAEAGGQYHWLDRKTNQPLTYKDGSEARFDDLDEAITAFIKGQLSAECNEVLV